MESCHLPNLSIQIAPDCISEYLNFQNFLGDAYPRTPLVSRDFVAPNGRSRAHIANILNYATPGLTNKKRLTPLSGEINLQSKQDITVCHVAKVKSATSAHYLAHVIPFLAYVLFPLNPML